MSDVGRFQDDVAETFQDGVSVGTHETDTAQLVVDTFGHELRWLQELRGWRICSRTSRPGYWSDEDREGVMQRLRGAAEAQAAWLLYVSADADGSVPRSVQREAAKLRTVRHLGAAERHARALLAARYDDFDARPHLLGVGNGVVDLATGELQRANPGLLLTKRASVPYDSTAVCPNWIRHVERVANRDPDVVELLRLAVGMTLLGHDDRKTHGFVNVWGAGGNGKGTFARTLSHVLGDYTHELPGRELTREGDKHSTSIADLQGKRLVTVSEAARKALDPDRVNYLTGGDAITARRMRQNNVTFEASHTLWLFSNVLPKLGDVGDSARRRYRPIQTAPPLTADERDVGWEEKLKGEAVGILAWAVRGCLDYQRAGWRLPEPKAMADLRDEHLEEQDLIGEWADERVERDPAAFETYQALVADLNRWRVRRRELREMTQGEQQDLIDWLRAEGLRSAKKYRQRVRWGLRLKKAPDLLWTGGVPRDAGGVQSGAPAGD